MQVARVHLEAVDVVDEASTRADQTVVVDDRHIAWVGPAADAPVPVNGEVVHRLTGCSVVPGLSSSHFHAAYDHVMNVNEIDMRHPATYLTIVAAGNVRTALECGFTSVVGAAAVHNIDVVLKRAIGAGLIPGPRILASSRDLCTTGGPVDMRPVHWAMHMEGVTKICDGPDEFRKAVREELKVGVDIVKLHVTGGHGSFDVGSEVLTMTRAELDAAVGTAHGSGRLVRGHVASREGILAALDAGLDVIDHGDGLDDDCIARMLELGTFLVPTLYLTWLVLGNVRTAVPPQPERLRKLEAEFDVLCAAVRRAEEAGVRLLVGDDFGAGPLRHGAYSNELEFYTDIVGIPSAAVLRWATTNAAALTGDAGRLGGVRAGYLADLVVVRGEISDSLRALRPQSIAMVMKDGAVVRSEVAPEPCTAS